MGYAEDVQLDDFAVEGTGIGGLLSVICVKLRPIAVEKLVLLSVDVSAGGMGVGGTHCRGGGGSWMGGGRQGDWE